MGDVFCLVILETGNRRKLKLATGTYAELVEKLAGLVELNLENTLIQMFDADLDDFVDLVPEDHIPNKAKLRVISRRASALCNASVAPCGQNVVPTCPRDPCASKAARVREQVDVSLLAPEAIGTQEAGNQAMETSEPVLAIEIPKEPVTCSNAAAQTNTAAGKDACGSMVDLKRMQDALREMLPLRPAGANNEATTNISNIRPAATYDGDDHLKFVLPNSFGVWCDIILETKRPVTKRVRRHMVSILFKACYKMTLYPTARLYQKVLDLLVMKYPHVMEGKYNRRLWSIALKSRFKTMRKKLVGASAVVKKERETRALGQVLGNADGDLDCAQAQQAFSSQKSPLSSSTKMSECEDMSSQEEECGGPKNTPANAARAELSHNLKPMPLDSVEVHLMSDLMECPVKTEPPDDQELMDCSNCCDAVLEDITVSQLLGMCNSKEASEALMAQEESRARPIKTERCEEPAEEVSHQEIKPRFMPEEQPQAPLDEPDCDVLAPSSKPEEQAQATSHKPDRVVPGPSLEPEEQAEATTNNSDSMAFELPSFGIFDNLLRAQVPANFMMQRHILHGLFEALAKTTLYPTKAQLKEAVDSLIHKYPHLSSMKGKTGKEFWMNALMNKFSGHRTAMADSILIPERPQRSCVAKRTQQRDQSGSAQHFLRPLRVGEQPSGDKDEVRRQGKRRASAAAGGRVDNHERERAALERHSATSEMTVEEIIFTFPVFRNESSLLEEFKVLWSTDIADCFEEGIKKLFLVLMNCGTNEEMRAISQPGNDVLLVVLNAIAMRCGEELNSVLVKGNALPTPCLVTCDDKSIDVFFNGSRLFVASSLLGGLCSLFASFWLFQREYSVCSQGVMTFLEHAFLNLNHTTPGPKCRMFIDLYRRVADIDSPW